MVLSPITKSNNTFHFKTISTSYIINLYESKLGIDVSCHFNDHCNIDIHECLDTKYRFVGNQMPDAGEKFYSDIEKKPERYYAPNKFESRKTFNQIKK